MIDHLEKCIVRLDSPREKVEFRDYLNRRLINTESKEFFTKFFQKNYECLSCYDIIFDPVYCFECNQVYCKNCILNTIPKENNLLCNHTNHTKTIEELPKIEKGNFEKIKVDCFFCDDKNLNLLTYPNHIECCKKKYEEKNFKTIENKTLDGLKGDNRILYEFNEKGLNAKLNEQIKDLELKIKEKDNVIHGFKINLTKIQLAYKKH